MLIQRTLLSAAILAAASLSVQAADNGNGFVSDSTLDLNLRTYYFNRDKIGQKDSVALSQGLQLNYKSGYAYDVLGFDASLFSSQKLAGDRGEGGTGLLRNESGAQRGYAKIGQAFIKAKLGENVKLKAGRMVLNTPLLNDSDSRSTPSSTQAVVAQGKFSGLDVYAIWSDRASAKTDESFNQYTDRNGDDYEVKVLGANYTFANKLGLSIAYGQAEDVLKQSYVNVNYPFILSEKMSLTLDGHFYSGEADGNATGHVNADYDSDLLNLAARFAYDNSKLTLSYQEVNGDEYEESWDGFNNDDTGLSTWNSVQRLDFDRADEESWQLRFDHKFKQVQGLSFMTRYTYGDNISRAAQGDGSEWERNVELEYAFQDVDGLSLRWRNSTVRSTETVDTNENRLILNYNIALK
jgi:imipenem/basic amino acid-specific outer membrane pore